MSTTSLLVSYSDMTWEIPIERRITVVSGDSGIGKTAMTNLLVNPSGKNVTVKFPMKIYVATRDSWELTVSSAKNSLIVFDDHPAVESARFAELVKETEKANNFFLIFSRTRIGTGKLDRLNIATTSILKLVTSTDGKHHYTEQYYKPHNEDIIIK